MNDANANYSSDWDIDQINLQDEADDITLVANTSSLAYVTLATYNVPDPPVAEAQFIISGDTVWRQFNDTSFSAFWVAVNMFLAITPTSLSLAYYNYNGTDATVNIRYQVWVDKVDY